MKILLSAYSCEPGQGSEPGVGWNLVREIAKYHQVWVLTRPDESKDIIEAELARNPVPNLHFVYFTLPFWYDSRRWGQAGGMQLHYYLWQIQAYFVARKLHRKIEFDVAHHITFVKYSTPSFLSLLPIPFIWGPVGGGETAPAPFWRDFSWRNQIYEWLRMLAREIGELDPFTWLTAQRSAIVYATTEDTAKRVRYLGSENVKIMPESGLFQHEIDRLAQLSPPTQSPVRFISIARLLHWKGLHLGLRAFAKANLPDSEYWLLGKGPELNHLQALSLDLGIAHKVKFLGHLPRCKVLDKIEQSSVLIHPSLHDSGGWVCLEAMAAGRPVICLDLGGPAEQVTSETGFRIPAHTPEQSVSDLAKAMIQLAENVNLRVEMGRRGQQRVQELFSWDVKGKLFTQIYQDLVSFHPTVMKT